jgi:hypothetical protein
VNFRRIGTAPSLSVIAPNAQATPNATPHNTFVTRPSTGVTDKVADSAVSKFQLNTPLSNGVSTGSGFKSDETGYISQHNIGQPILNAVSGSHPSTSQHVTVSHSNSLAGSVTSRPRSEAESSGGIQARSIISSKFTVTNMGDDAPIDSPLFIRPAQQSPPPGQQSWISAEEEKRRLYERAKAQVDRVQGVSQQGPPIQVCFVYWMHLVT